MTHQCIDWTGSSRETPVRFPSDGAREAEMAAVRSRGEVPVKAPLRTAPCELQRRVSTMDGQPLRCAAG